MVIMMIHGDYDDSWYSHIEIIVLMIAQINHRASCYSEQDKLKEISTTNVNTSLMHYLYTAIQLARHGSTIA